MDRRAFLRAGAALGMISLAGRRQVEGGVHPGTEATTWLSWNENPYGLPTSARRAALEAVDRAHRYPDRARAELATRVAELNGVEPANVVIGCGSTQILQSLVLQEAAADKPLVIAEPTFEAMIRYQRPWQFRVERVPLDSRYAHDIGRMRERVGSGGALVYICNPNNPTATLTPGTEIDAWISEASGDVMFTVDEAYHEYVEAEGYRSAVRWIADRPNVVVTRTFSKIYAMAGLRLGYALCHERTARRLRQFVSADNASGVALAAAGASLADPDVVPRSREANAAAKKIAIGCLDELALAHLPSHANFLMHRVNGDLSSYIERMRESGIRVGRPFPPMLEFNRLTLGLPGEMERWAETLRSFRAQGHI